MPPQDTPPSPPPWTGAHGASQPKQPTPHPTHRRWRWAGTVAFGAVATVAALALASSLQSLTGIADAPRPDTRPPVVTVLSAYTGAAGKGTSALPRWEAWTGTKAPYALDFASSDSWANISGPAWLLAPWRDSGRRLIYSVPLFPHPATQANDGRHPLDDCATGRYESHWTKLGRQLIDHRLPTTIIRPGWEFNGDWYPWAAAGREQTYATCYRRVVTALRSIPGQQFEFVWNPDIGPKQFPAEYAYPGNAYVDYIGVDVYDTSWRPGTYPIASHATGSQRAAIFRDTWNETLNGNHGLRFWSEFAEATGKYLAVPEWGLSARFDGRGGGDNPHFIERMIDFIRDPTNRVAFALYFDADTDTNLHRISTDVSAFPAARRRFQTLMTSPATAERSTR